VRWARVALYFEVQCTGRLVMPPLTLQLFSLSDGEPKDPHYIFKLYVSLGNFPQAAKTAVVIARKEQELGNYKAAHAILLDTLRDLEAHSIRIPLDMMRTLTLLHSYLLVKKLVKVRPLHHRRSCTPSPVSNSF
jgi:hypothetical protein